MPYSEIREQLQTGDIVLFSGATTSGALIKMFDGSVFSHVGIVSVCHIMLFILEIMCQVLHDPVLIKPVILPIEKYGSAVSQVSSGEKTVHFVLSCT